MASSSSNHGGGSPRSRNPEDNLPVETVETVETAEAAEAVESDFHYSDRGSALESDNESDWHDDEDDSDDYGDNNEVQDDDDNEVVDEDQRDLPAIEILNYLRSAEGVQTLTIAQVAALLNNPGIGELLHGDDPEADAEFLGRWERSRSRTPKDPDRFPKVPSAEGAALMRSGVFGTTEMEHRHRSMPRRFLERELAIGSAYERQVNSNLITQKLLPQSRADMIVHYDEPVYSGQFSDDGNFFYACSQDFKVRMYDTSSPFNWQHYKTVTYPWGHWTLTDASLSPDNKWLAFTSINSIVAIAPTNPKDEGDPYTLELGGDSYESSRQWGWHGTGFGIWSIRFSGDGRELVAGTNSHSIVVYDIESRRVLHSIHGHKDDVNAVCFADKQSPHIIYSGSDDAVIKIWDRRSLGDGREAGALVGHIEGLTYIDSKDDGRYILSNGKDQSMKLWDVRNALSRADFVKAGSHRWSRRSGYDYRSGEYDDDDWDVHPQDRSVVTFRGHQVLRTLIRCHFSPPTSSNSRYVYSGSTDGKVYIWNIDATLARTIDVGGATDGTRPSDRGTGLYRARRYGGWATCVRDASWHPSAPMLVASAWNGYNMSRGTCTVHSYHEGLDDDGDPPMGRSVDDQLKPQPNLHTSKYPWN